MLKQLFTFAILFCLSFNAWSAAPTKVVFLSSLKTPKKIWHWTKWDIADGLEARIHEAFDNSGFTVVTKRNATAQDLADALAAPDNAGVFWLSHAASDDNEKSPFGLSDIIADEDGIDVSGIFEKVNPNLRWLAVIGCSDKAIIDDLKANGAYKNNPNLQILSFDQKVDVYQALNYSINQSVASLGSDKKDYGDDKPDPYSDLPTIVAKPELVDSANNNLCPSDSGFPVYINREADPSQTDPMVAVQIYFEDHFIGMLPASTEPRQGTLVYIPQAYVQEAKDGGYIEFTLDSRFAGFLKTRANFGSFSFHSMLPSDAWKINADATGVPTGITDTIYRYKGDKNIFFAPENLSSYQPFPCNGSHL